MSDQYNDSGLDAVSGSWSPQENASGSGLVGRPLHAVRQDVENTIFQAIDHYSSQVPGGSRFTPEAKQAVSGILDNLQQQLENEAQNRLGNIGGGLLGGNEGGQGGSQL